jgi:osmoprotectant transport system permease protein
MPGFFAQHLLLSVVALCIGLCMSLPLALLAMRVPRLRTPVLGLANVVQTVPSLALLALMVPLLGMIGFVPAAIALALFSMLPVLRNTLTGLIGVSPVLIEAARGVGMTEWQTLRKVQLPLAAPTIIAGLRTAAVGVVGMATLATPVGQTTLGNYIFTGLQTQNSVAVLLGCVAAGVMALALDGVIRLVEHGAGKHSRRLQLAGIGSFAVLLLVGLSPLASSTMPRDGRPTLVVGAKTFTEQQILASLIADRVERSGFLPITQSSMGSHLLFDALAKGSIDCYVDYSGTIWTDVMKRQDMPGTRQMHVAMKRWLANHHGITVAGRLGFENTYTLTMPKARALELGVTSISDLRAQSMRLRLGGDVEFFSRPEWARAREAYSLEFGQIVGLETSTMFEALRNGQVDVLATFSSDGRIPKFDLAMLKDDRDSFPAYDALILLSANASRRPEVVSSMQSLVMTIDDDLMRRTNMMVDVTGRSPFQAAQYLSENLMADSSQAVAPVATPEEVKPDTAPLTAPVEAVPGGQPEEAQLTVQAS